MTDLLATSEQTWRAVEPSGPDVRIPETLHPPTSGTWSQRLDALKQRHELRRQRAEAFFETSRNPERGLPVAPGSAAAAFLWQMLAERRLLAIGLIGLNALAAVAGLVVPRLLGNLIDEATTSTSGFAAHLNGIVIAVIGVVVVQAVLTFLARWSSALFGQTLLAVAREHIVRTVLGLPLSKVESSSTGDLVTRVTRDVGTMSGAVRWALPNLVIAVVMTGLTLVAMFINNWILALPMVAALVLLAVVGGRYLRRAPQAYILEGGTYSQINTTLTETVDGARTVEALGLEQRRIDASDSDIAESAQAERYGMTLRNLLFLWLDYAYQGPLVFIVLLGTWGYAHDLVTLGQMTAAAIYTQQVIEPMDRLVQCLDRLLVGAASTTRLLGIAEVPQDRTPGDERPRDEHVIGTDLHFAYREGHDVLHGVDLDLTPGERLAIVGPSGSGKSTLGRLLSGINAPRVGSVTVGDVDVMALPLDLLRTEVALVTQEHHVFVGTVRDNIVLAREQSGDEVVKQALEAVEAWSWVERLPKGLDTMLGSGNTPLTPAQAQQVALARLVVADPHTLVLDEATSLIDPTTARHLEGSMAALLEGRAVIAIAHRLHTAHDADRIAVVIDGRVAELGSHDELMALDGEYAALWHAWTS